ncbi:hypothetical protein F7725_022355 [Dissostichus mawsoni]|uniref:Myb/SANT-like DNA-binding domain-containing protein n=1 Tax=Dissostichus mawsoni TaxID=36200 RepID=A0A7J5YXV7_DISMA|nr:hypothetical protein F7725_022355 [Dissostichus mawsoni]
MTLIKVRAEKDTLFTGRRHTAKKAWELLETSLVSLREILKALNLFYAVTPTRIAKKWDNLKRKYKMHPNRDRDRQGRGHSSHMAYFTAMHEAIGGRPSINPPTLMYSATAAVASGSGSTSTEAVQSQATVEDEEATESGSDSQEDVEPSTSAGPPPSKKKSLNYCIFWRRRRQKRRTASTASRQHMRKPKKKFLELFEQLVKK